MMMTMSNACDQDSFCDALVYCRGTKRDKSKSRGKGEKKETRTREKVTRKERCEKKMKSRRRLERERERERDDQRRVSHSTNSTTRNSLIRKTQPTTHAYWYILFTKL